MIRRPPRSPPFPYTPLFRSRAGESRVQEPDQERDRRQPERDERRPPDLLHRRPAEDVREEERGDRSEEHTSELQSRQYLVCRLLLEKKNTLTLTNNHSLY